MCKACGHPYEDHIFGGMCRHCDCRRCVYGTEPFRVRREPQQPAGAPKKADEQGEKRAQERDGAPSVARAPLSGVARS